MGVRRWRRLKLGAASRRSLEVGRRRDENMNVEKWGRWGVRIYIRERVHGGGVKVAKGGGVTRGRWGRAQRTRLLKGRSLGIWMHGEPTAYASPDSSYRPNFVL